MGLNDRNLNVSPNCLMFLIDETGHEELADPNYPVFGVGGCAIVAAQMENVIRAPWRALKAQHFGGADVPLHAADLKNPSKEQLEALSAFFQTQRFGRFAAIVTSATKLSPP